MSTTFVAALDFRPQRSVASLSRILQGRRDYLMEELEKVCRVNTRPRILSVSNGVLREAEPVLPFCTGEGGEFVAFDQHIETLKAIRQEYGSARLRCVHGGLSSLTETCGPSEFDFIYALNLLSELQPPAARQILRRLARLLRHGGSLLVSSFTPEIQACGYMEHALSPPVFRTEFEMVRLANSIPDRDMVGHVIWRDETETIVYLEVHK